MKQVNTIDSKTFADDDELEITKVDLLFTQRPPRRLKIDKYKDYFEEIRNDKDIDVQVSVLNRTVYV